MSRIIKLIITSIILTTCLMCLSYLGITPFPTDASDKTVNIVDDSGNTVKYRNSSEVIKRLETYNYPTQELRAAWVSNFISSLPAYSSKDKWISDFNHVLDTMQSYGLNTIIFHVRTHNNALYKSELNPIATWFKNVNFDEFDPLAYCIEETHKRGMEFHAWLNPYRINNSYVAGELPSVNPANDDANILKGSSEILNPGLPNVRKFLVDTCMEVVENYDVDAIHFDDYFYVSGVDDTQTRAQYNPNNLSMADWRREQVNIFIKDLALAIRTYNKNNQKAVQLGISPSGIYRNGSYASTPSYNDKGDLISPIASNTSGFAHYDNYLYSDTLKWINEEWIDYIMPQTYWSLEHTAASFGALSRWWSWAVKNKKVNLYLGLGIYMPTQSGSSATYWQKNTNEIRDQLLNAAMYDEIGGISFYSYNYLTNENKYIKTGMDIVKNDYFNKFIPGDVKKYQAELLDCVDVTNIKIVDDKITWDKATNVRGYVVYKVANNKVLDQNDIEQILYYGTNNYISIDSQELESFDYKYYVSTVNLANEISKPLEVNLVQSSVDSVIALIDKLPTPITIDDYGKTLKIKEILDTLTVEELRQVTNYETYYQKVELLIKKMYAYELMTTRFDYTLYTIDTESIIKEKVKEFRVLIDKANNDTELDNCLNSFKEYIATIPLKEVELKNDLEYYKEQVNKLYAETEEHFYTDENLVTKQNLKTNALDDLDKARSSEELKNVYQTYLSALKEVENFKDLYQANYLSIKSLINKKVDEFLVNYTWLESFDIANDANNYLDAAAYKYYEVAYTMYDILNDISDKLDLKLSEYNSIKNHRLDIEIEISNYEAEGSVDEINSLKDEYIEMLRVLKTVEEIDKLYKEFVDKVNSLKTPTTPSTPTNPEKEGCFNKANIIMEMILMTSLLSFVILKKKH